VRPDRRGWTAFHSASAQAAETRTSHVDYLLRFVIERSIDDTQRGIVARIDALERTLSTLTRPWRAENPIAPARELRLSSATLATLLAWLEAGGPPDRAALERLGVYASGALTDERVPEGWVRLNVR